MAGRNLSPSEGVIEFLRKDVIKAFGGRKRITEIVSYPSGNEMAFRVTVPFDCAKEDPSMHMAPFFSRLQTIFRSPNSVSMSADFTTSPAVMDFKIVGSPQQLAESIALYNNRASVFNSWIKDSDAPQL